MILFTCALSLFPDLSMFLLEKVLGENLINVIEGEVVGLGDLLELFNESRGINSIRPLLSLVHLMRRGHKH